MGIPPMDEKPLIIMAKNIDELKNNPAALEAFWNEVSRAGAPLVEPLEGNTCLVTFLWRDEEGLENVVLHTQATGYDPDKSRLERLPGANLWYLSLELENDLRTTYNFSLNDPLTPLWEDPNIDERMAALRTDPFNPLRTESLQYEVEELPYLPAMSILELPAAKPQPWAQERTGVPRGSVEMHRLHSAILDNERRVWTYTPPGYDPAGPPYPLLIVLDGMAAVGDFGAPTTLDNLLADGRIPPFVGVFPDSLSREARSRELPCHQPFADFLVQELLPWARQRLHFSQDPQQVFIAGASYGGLASSYAALQYPQVFGNVISMSGSYWFPAGSGEGVWLGRQYMQAPTGATRFYMDVGKLETLSLDASLPTQLQANRHMRDILLAKGYAVHYVEFSGGHDMSSWRGTLADGLLALLEMQNSEN